MRLLVVAGKAALKLTLSSLANWSNRVACEQSPALPPGLRCLSPRTLGLADLLPAEKRPTRSERQESALKSAGILLVSIPRVQRPREENEHSAGKGSG